MTRTTKHLIFETNSGLHLHGDQVGKGPCVLLLHGGGQTRHAWSETAARLESVGMQAITVDLRGHGESDWDPGGNYSIDAFVADVSDVIEQIGSDLALIGASLGGIVGMLLTGERASSRSARLVTSLVLVDVAPRIDVAGVSKIRAFMTAHPDGFESVEEAAAAVRAYLPHRPPPSSLDGLKKNLILHEDGRYRWHWDPEFMRGDQRPEALENSGRLREAARNLGIPTLLVRGKLSDLLTEDGVAEFRSAVPHAEFVDVAGAGHMVAGDSNDAFGQAVVDFLVRHHTG